MDTAKLFLNGRSQAIRLPKAYRLHGAKVYLKRISNTILIIPEQHSWQVLIDSLDLFSNDFMDSREQPDSQIRKPVFA